MELFSLSNSNLLHNEENSRLVPDQYVEMINSRDISIVEFPKLKNIDLYLLKYYAKLIYVDPLNDEHFAERFMDRELFSYEFPPGHRLNDFSMGQDYNESHHPKHKKHFKKYYHVSALLLQRFLNSSIFWFLNTIKEDHQLDMRSLLTKIKTSEYHLKVNDTVSTSSTMEKGKSPNSMEDDDLPF